MNFFLFFVGERSPGPVDAAASAAFNEVDNEKAADWSAHGRDHAQSFTFTDWIH